ncbi:MAG: formimidoylglutamase [Flavobacteriales bacterium]
MNDISIYFQALADSEQWSEQQLGNVIIKNQESFPELEKNTCAIFYVPEFRGSERDNQQRSTTFRSALYGLHHEQSWKSSIYDLGDILPGNTLEDTYFAVTKVVAELVKNQIIPIVIGGSQDLTVAMYSGYEKLEQLVNICSVDHSLDLGTPDEEIHANGFLSQILLKRPCYLFNHANIGLQIPYASAKEFDLFEKLYFDICRLGEFNQDFTKAEPHLRNADIINIDFNSIKASETLNPQAIPNGFYAEQICQIARYAGISDKVTSFGIFNFESISLLSDKLLAEMIWYFIQGVMSRKGDFPIGSKTEYTRFTVFLEESNREIIFYKSNKSARWWMEVPYPPQSGTRYERHHMVPCNKLDYDNAMNNEMPDLWWKTYQKLG